MATSEEEQTIFVREMNEAAREMMLNGVYLSPAQVLEIGDDGIKWLEQRLGLLVTRTQDGAECTPANDLECPPFFDDRDWRGASVEVWECAPTTFARAARAWVAASHVVATPLFPPEFLALVIRHCTYTIDGVEQSNEPSVEVVRAMVVEAYRRAVWLPPWEPPMNDHPYDVKGPRLTVGRRRLELDWNSSVRTSLVRDARGWRVRIVGQHEQRRRAAEEALAPS